MKRFLQLLMYGVLGSAVRMLYRVRATGLDRLPPGPFLLVANHVSYADAVVIGALLGPRVRFVMWRHFYEKPVIGWVCRLFDAIPVEPEGPSGQVRGAIEKAVAALQSGAVLCLFPEGTLTRTGHVHAFRRGFEMVARRAGAPVVPAYLDGLWGSVFSFERGRILWKLPRGFRRRVTVCFGAPLPPETGSLAVRRAVLELGAQAYGMRKAWQEPLPLCFWRAARRRGGRLLLADVTGMELSGRRTLAGALAVAHWMRRRCREEPMLGMMMPASVAATLINAAAVLCGKTPVNLNFTSSRAAVDEAVRRCRLRTVFTSRKFLGKIGMTPRLEFVYLEDVMEEITSWERVRSLLLATFVPAWLARRTLLPRCDMDALATVMFTSGSTGKPKGVMLSHHNIVSNIQSMADVFQFNARDGIVGVLPPFHAFGFTVTAWLPLCLGVRALYNPNPLDAKGIGDLIARYRATILLGTPSFLAVYTRGCAREQFQSLRIIISGGQKLLPVVAEAFEQHFGKPISEGYGCTELSPVVSVNIEDVELDGVRQKGTQRGSVGRPFPGLAVRIADPETLGPHPEDAPGIVLITGPTVMMGYRDDPEATAQAVRDGWYVTADLGTLDDEGFLHIHDRVSRFSKIGGEMVGHAAVENALQAAEGAASRNFAVLSVPDRVRGERLVVLYDGPALDAAALETRMQQSGVPNLWLPALRDFHAVPAVPLLASGKLDLREARRIVEEIERASEGASA